MLNQDEVNVKILLPINYIVLKNEIKDSWIIPGFNFIPANQTFDGDMRYEEWFERAEGKIETDMIKSFACLYYVGNLEYLMNIVQENNVYRFLSIFNTHVINPYFNLLWLRKDHSINYGKLYLYSKEFKFNSNHIPEFYNKAEGCFENIELLEQDILEVNNLYRIFSSKISEVIKEKNKDQFPSKPNQKWDIVRNDIDFNSYTYNKIHRCIIILGLARSKSFLPAKISFYIMMLECLFSLGGETEISHKACERAAFFLGSDGKERRVTYNHLKNAYDIRSSFVHGDKIRTRSRDRGTFVDFKKTSIEVDIILRNILYKIVSNESNINLFISKEEETLRTWFLDRIIGEN